MPLDRNDIEALTAFRRRLHARPELSGDERETAAAVSGFLRQTQPDRLIEGLGGHGLAAIFAGPAPGPTLMFRAELDGLPILELSGAAHRSEIEGRSHLCGHDGHMAALAGMAVIFARRRPERGRVALLFQPAEENGAGARAVIGDRKFAEVGPDLVFAWHNMPGLPLGRAALKAGAMNCASRGMRINLSGRPTHASTPELGVSPMQALAGLMPELTDLGRGGAVDADYALVTVTHAELGGRAFGIAPGAAEIWLTLRTRDAAPMERLVARAEALARRAAEANGLGVAIAYEDVFAPCANAPEAVARLMRALDAEGVAHDDSGLPMRASEDFGLFGAIAPSAMFLLGAGEACPGLHDPEYDFPDALIGIAARVMARVARDALG